MFVFTCQNLTNSQSVSGKCLLNMSFVHAFIAIFHTTTLIQCNTHTHTSLPTVSLKAGGGNLPDGVAVKCMSDPSSVKTIM